MLAMSSPVFGISGLVRRLDTGALFPIIFLGLILGWLLGRSALPTWAAFVLGIAMGIGAAFFQTGRMGNHLYSLLTALSAAASRGWPWQASWIAAVKALADFFIPMNVLYGRAAAWLSGTISGGAVFDPVATMLAWSILFWMVTIWAGFAVRRWNQVFLATLPGGALLALSLNFTRGSVSPLLLWLAATLLLKAFVDLDQSERGWVENRMDFSEYIRPELYAASCMISLVLVSAAAFSPSLSIKKIVDFTQHLTEKQASQADQVAISLGLPRPTAEPRSLQNQFAPGMPRSHLLGSGPELSQKIVMIIQTNDPPPPPRFYWRSLTYDIYTGQGWITGKTTTERYVAQTVLDAGSNPTRHLLIQQVTYQEEPGPQGFLLYFSGSLVSVDKEYKVDWRRPPQLGNLSNPPGNRSTVENSDLFGGVLQARTYQAATLVPTASIEQLRSAGQDYPKWIQQRYLALPANTPSRVLALARDLTATQPTPYDRAKAIESYLRSFPYTLDLPSPPADQDVVDYFLFTLKRGYCDYYASAMVVLARAAGLPARLVVGYASGKVDASHARYVISEADAHSWPEIFFPRYGWIEFEPTAGQPALLRPDQAQPTEISGPIPGSQTFNGPGRSQASGIWSLQNWMAGILILIACLFAVSGGWLLAEEWRLSRLPSSAALSAVYRQLLRFGRRLAVPVYLGETPHEFALSLADRILLLSRRGRLRRSISPAAQEVGQLTDLYTKAIYSPVPLGKNEQNHAIKIWVRLRRRLWLAQLLAGFSLFRQT
jgi:transglutaminase-like putative cysteine protease